MCCNPLHKPSLHVPQPDGRHQSTKEREIQTKLPQTCTSPQCTLGYCQPKPAIFSLCWVINSTSGKHHISQGRARAAVPRAPSTAPTGCPCSLPSSSWPLSDPHSSSGLTAPPFQVNPSAELFPLMLSPLDFSPHCYLHPAFLKYPNHLGPTTFAPMPVALLKECTTNDGFTARTALCSFPSHSLPFQAALLTHNPYSLQIPLDKSLLPSSFQLLTRFLQTNQTLQPGSQGLLYPPHLLLCLFSGSHGKIP